MDRQQFIRAGLGVGAAAAASPVVLVELLAPTQPTRIPSVVSLTHVAEVRATAEAFRGWDARYGGGLMREAAVAQLRHCAELLNAHCSEAVRRELLTAVGSFAETAGFMADDDYAHDDARRMYHFALACAEEAQDWHLRAQVLCSTAFQASWSGDPDAGLAYTESALVRSGRLTATQRAMLHNSRARARARDQIRLASLIMATGDPLEAAALGTQALDWAGPLRSRRATDDLHELRRLTEPHTHRPEIADLSQRIGTLIAT